MKKTLPVLGFLIFLLCGVLVLRATSRSFWRDPRFHPNALTRGLEALERAWFDIKFRLKEAEAAEEVLVATVDDASLKRFGRWPWSRAVYGEILQRLYGAGASVVAFDAVFSEPELSQDIVKRSFAEPVPSLKGSLSQTLKLKDADVELISKNLPEIGDRIFAAAVGTYPNTVLGYIWLFDRENECAIYDRDRKADQEKYGILSNADARARGLMPLSEHEDALGALYSQSFSHPSLASFNPKNKGGLFLSYCVVGNRSSISALAKHSGAFNTIHDDDGIVRRSQLLFAFDPASLGDVPEDRKLFFPPEWFSRATYFPGLSLRALMAHWQVKKVDVVTEEGSDGLREVREIVLERADGKLVKIPTLPDASLLTRFYGRQHAAPPPIRSFSLADLEYLSDPNFQKSFFGEIRGARPLENKIVFIGPTALGVYDIRPTAIQQDMPGVYVHATTASRILDFAKGALPPGLQGISWVWHAGAFVILAALILALALTRHFWKGLLFNFIVLASVPLGDLFLFRHSARVFHAPTFVLLLLVTVFILALYRYFTEERQKSFVKSAFQKYVSPEVVQSILANPSSLNLGGKKVVVTLLFSDIRGFTSLAEKMEASQLSQFLNEYLSAMTDVILEHGGTIDKYIGDAIVAIFGAPVAFPDHADRALRAARGMSEKLKNLNERWAGESKPRIEIGMGINSGEASVGNMGSKQIFSYTAMGDSVNLAARLESLNKQYGTELLVSAETLRLSQEKADLQPLDRVRVQGKERSVEISTRIPASSEASYSRYREAFRLYSERKFGPSLDLLRSEQDFVPARNLSRRCELFLKDPPPPEWDGTWTIQEK